MELFAADGHDAGGCERVTGKSGMRPDRLPLEPPAETNPTPTHANIRGADYYATTTTEEDRC